MPKIAITVAGERVEYDATDAEMAGLSAARKRAMATLEKGQKHYDDDVAYLEARISEHCVATGEVPAPVIKRALESWVGWKS